MRTLSEFLNFIYMYVYMCIISWTLFYSPMRVTLRGGDHRRGQKLGEPPGMALSGRARRQDTQAFPRGGVWDHLVSYTPPPPLLPRTSHLLAATAWQMPAMSPVPGGNNCMKCGLAKGVRMCREYCVTHTLCLHQRVELFSLTSKLRYPLCVTHIQVAKP